MKYFKRDNFSKAILNGLVLKLQSICQWKASMLSILFHISSWVKLKCDSWHPDQDHSSPSSNIPCHAPAWYLQSRVIANLFQRSPNFENTLLDTLSLVRGRDINTVGGEHLHHNWAGAPQRRTHGQGWYYFVAITKFSWSWLFSKWQPIIILFSPHSVVDGELDSRLPTPFYLLFMALSRLLQVTRLLNKSWHFTSPQTTRLLHHHHIISCHHNRTKLRH